MPTTKPFDGAIDAKAQQVIAYLGSWAENLSATDTNPDTSCSVRLIYDAEVAGMSVIPKVDDQGRILSEGIKGEDGKVIDNQVVVAVGQIEQDFAAILATLPTDKQTSFVAIMTAIANFYSPYK